MRRPEVLPVFEEEELNRARHLLGSRVAAMMGRKFEEGDWSFVYCHAKEIPDTGWSNLSIDVLHEGLGVEQKMLCVKSNKPIKEYCGTTLMHPSATRSIRIPDEEDPTAAARDVLQQYGELIERRRERVRESSETGEADVRTGWLLWQDSLREFVYFEEEMLPPDPSDYWAEWRESGGGRRKKSKNLWVYENESGQKRFSITTSAGAKIQPYFDVPPPKHENLYYFLVQGEPVGDGLVRLWVTKTTAQLLTLQLGTLDSDALSERILEAASEKPEEEEDEVQVRRELAVEVRITIQAYEALSEAFGGVSDEHMVQQFLRFVGGAGG